MEDQNYKSIFDGAIKQKPLSLDTPSHEVESASNTQNTELLKYFRRRMLVATTLPTIIILAMIVAFFGWQATRSNEVRLKTGSIVPVYSIDQDTLPDIELSVKNPVSEVVINSRLVSNGGIVLRPKIQPAKSELGEIYFDEASRELRMSDGKIFRTIVTSQNSQGSSSVCYVAEECGFLTDEDQVILPQDLSVSARPTFAGLNLEEQIAVASGGTGVTSFASNALVIGNGSGALDTTNTPIAGQLVVASSSSRPTFVSVGGDATLSAAGVFTLSNNSVGSDELSSNGVASGTYGNGITFPVLTVDSDGRITNVSTLPLPGGGLGVGSLNALSGAVLVAGQSNQINITPSGNTLTIALVNDFGSSIESAELTDGTLQLVDFGQNGCSDSQVIKWNQTLGRWICDTDAAGNGTLTFSTFQVPSNNGANPYAETTNDTLVLQNGSGISISGIQNTGSADSITIASTLGSAIDLNTAEVTNILGVTNGGTGASSAGAALGNLGAAASGSNSDITQTNSLNTITPNAALTIGATLRTFTLQGSIGSTISVTNGTANTTQISFANFSANRVYTIPESTVASDSFCLVALANCTGGGVGGSGTSGRIARFSGSNSITSSILSESTNTVSLIGSAGSSRFDVGDSANPGAIGLLASNGRRASLAVSNNAMSADLTFRLPSDYGTSNYCLVGDAAGGLSFANCGIGGGAGTGITSLNGDNNVAQTISISSTGSLLEVSDTGAGQLDIRIPLATGTNNGLVSTSAQTFNGIKTFTNGIVVGGETFTDFTGTGLNISGGSLIATLGTDIETNEIANGTILFADLASNGCSNDGVIKYNGTVWICGVDANGSGTNAFSTIGTPDNADPVADSTTDVLELLQGSGISITGDNVLDTVTIAATLGTSIDLSTSEVTGVLGLTNGGTGQTSQQAAIDTLTNFGSGPASAGRLLYSNGTNAIPLDRGGNGTCLVSGASTISWTTCTGDGVGITTIGTLNSQAKSGNGAVISGSSIFLQTAEAGFPGLVSTGTQTFAGVKTFQDGVAGLSVTNAGNVAFQRNASDIATAGTVELTTPTGSLFRFTNTITLTGMTGGSDGRRILVINAGVGTVTFNNEDAAATAANRIVTGTGNAVGLPAGSSIELVYDSGASRWRLTSAGAATSAVSGAYIQNQNVSAQSASNFWLSGSGRADTSFIAPALERGTSGTLSVGTTSNTTSITVGGTNLTGTLAAVVGTGGTLRLGNSGVASTIQIGNTTGAVTQTINLGNNATLSSITNLTAGSLVGSSTTTIQGGTGGVLLNAPTGSVRVGTIGTSTGQLYVSGNIPTAASGAVSTTSSPSDLFIQGKYGYVTAGGVLRIFDVSNPASITSVGSYTFSFNPGFVYVQGKYAYIGTNSNVQIVDISNPTSPTLVGSVATGQVMAIYVHGRYAYVTTVAGNLFRVIDISNPTSPVITGSVATTNTGQALYVQGNYAYVVSGTSPNAFQAINISNPANPVIAGTLTVGMSAFPASVYVSGRYAYIASKTGTQNISVVDISNPASPTFASQTTVSGTPSGVSVQGRYAYITNQNNNTIQVFDATNPASLTSLGTIPTNSQPSDIFVQGRYAYVINASSNTLQAFDIGGGYIQQLEVGGLETGTISTNGNVNVTGDQSISGGLTVGQSLQVSGSAGIGGNLNVNGVLPATFISSTTINSALQVEVAGPYAYVVTNQFSGAIFTYDVSNPSSPSVGASTFGVGGISLAVQGKYGYVLDSTTFKSYDLTRPNSPTLVGTLASSCFKIGAVQGRYFYCIDTSNNFNVIDIGNPARPTLVGTVATSCSNSYFNGHADVVQNGYFYCSSPTTFYVINANNPSSPSVVGSLSIASIDMGVVLGRYFYTSAGSVIDVSNPVAPLLVAGVSTNCGSFGMVGQGRRLYCTAGGNTITVVDLGSNGITPTTVGTITGLTSAYSLEVVGRYLYVVDAPGGASNTLKIYDLGGVYTLSLDAGGVQAGTLTTQGDAFVNGRLSAAGGLSVNLGVQITGGSTVNGDGLFVSATNSTTAFRIQNATSVSLLTTDTTNSKTIFNRAADGTLLEFSSASTVQGTITVAGTTVSYNAFTGSHYGLFDGASATRGQLVDLTGNNSYKAGSAEPIYGIVKTAVANSPNVLGAHLATQDPSAVASLDNPELVMAAGNGDVWIADNGSGNVVIGDTLISSGAVAGHAMRDNKQYVVSHIFAKAAESIDWGTVTAEINGVKVAKVSVLFSYYNQDNTHTLGLLQGSNLDISGNALFGGDISVSGSLNVTGPVAFSSLTVSANLTVLQDLTVAGSTSVQNLTINGKIITAGATPTIVLGAQATGQGATVVVTGNDVAGNVTYEAGIENLPGNPLALGEQAVVTFVAPYTTQPRVTITPNTEASAKIRYYIERTTNEFRVVFVDQPVAGQTYSFDYQIIQ